MNFMVSLFQDDHKLGIRKHTKDLHKRNGYVLSKMKNKRAPREQVWFVTETKKLGGLTLKHIIEIIFSLSLDQHTIPSEWKKN